MMGAMKKLEGAIDDRLQGMFDDCADGDILTEEIIEYVHLNKHLVAEYVYQKIPVDILKKLV